MAAFSQPHLTSSAHMTSLRLPALAFLALLAPLTAQTLDLLGGAGKKESVTASLVWEVKAAAPGQAFRVAVKLEHQPHFHTYGKVIAPGVTGKPTKLDWTLPEGWKVEELRWPATTPFDSFGAKADGYQGVVHLPARLVPPASATAGSEVEIGVKVDGLVCDDKTCLPFNQTLTLKLPLAANAETDPAHSSVFPAETAAPPAAPATPPAADTPAPPAAAATGAPVPEHGFSTLLLFAFLGGLILNIMPCVFPVLGIKVMSIVNQAGGDRGEVVRHGLAYTAGVLVSFWALAVLVITLGKGWGFQLQSPGFVLGLCFFFLVFAMNMAGVFEIGTSAVGVGTGLQSKSGLGGSFFTGLLATIVATPCSAPFLAPALAYALGLPVASALVFFTLIALGLAFPFLLLSFFPALVSRLPRPGAWMESFKQGMSFLLFGTAAYMIWIYDGLADPEQLQDALIGLVIAAAGAWVYGRWFLPHKAARTRLIAILTALAMLGGGFALAFTSPSALHWVDWSKKLEKYHLDLKEPVYIDFTARWCATCQVNKSVYKIPAVKDLMRDRGVVLMRADWTLENDEIKKELERLGRAAVPTNILYIPGQEPYLFPDDELLTEENVTAALKRIPQR